MPGSAYELWRTLDTASGEDWEAFTTELCTLYPGSNGDQKYNWGHLDALVERTSREPMTDHIHFGEYYRSFLTITRFFKTKERINERETSAKFFSGLHYSFRGELKDHLCIKEPTHHIDDPWDLKILYDAALFLLSNRNGGTSTKEAPLPKPEGQVKTEAFDTTSITKFLESDVFLARIASLIGPNLKMHGQYQPGQYQPAPQNQYNTPTQSAAYTNNTVRTGPNLCVFCSDPGNFQFSCAIAADYIARGLCVHNDQGQLILPNGVRITYRLTPGSNIKERLNNWHQYNPSTTTASTNFVNVADPADITKTKNLTWDVFSQMIKQDPQIVLTP